MPAFRSILTAALLLAAGCATPSVDAPADSPASDLAALLGLPDSTRFLVIHADDLGLTPEVNAGTVQALDRGYASSASIIATGEALDGLREIGSRADQPDLGVHLTLTSESPILRLAPAAAPEKVPSLMDSTGNLPMNGPGLLPRPGDEIESELMAQIELVKSVGILPTHLDSHQGTLFGDSTAFAALLRVAGKECLPILISRGGLGQARWTDDATKSGFVAIDRVVSINPSVPPEEWAAWYTQTLRDLRPGVTELIVHLGVENVNSRADFSANSLGWGAEWRQRDLDAVSDPAFRSLIDELGIRLVSWSDIAMIDRICE